MDEEVVVKFPCEHCESSFSRKSNLSRHIKNQHDGVQIMVKCHICKSLHPNETSLNNHYHSEHPIRSSFKIKQQGLKCSIVWYTKLLNTFMAVEVLLTPKYQEEIIELINQNLQVLTHLR